MTIVFVVGPLVALLYALVHFWGHGVSARDIILAVALYAIIGHGVTVGFHRLFAHRSFRAVRVLKIALAVAGSIALAGVIIPWLPHHPLHHTPAHQAGDP